MCSLIREAKFQNFPGEHAPGSIRKAKFQNFPGEHAPDPPRILVSLALDPIFAGSIPNCFRQACYDTLISISTAIVKCCWLVSLAGPIFFNQPNSFFLRLNQDVANQYKIIM